MTIDRVRVAVIGAGDFGSEHIEAYEAVAGARLAAVVERDEAQRHGWRARLGGQGVGIYATVSEMLEHVTIDAASIVTPGSTHRNLSLELMEAGIDVLIEKPFADTVADAEAIAAAVTRTGRICVPGHIMRHAAAHVALKRRIAQKELGDVMAVALRRDRSHDLVRRFPGVHPALLTGVHDFDLAIWFMGQRVISVSATEHRGRGGDVDFFAATLWHEGGGVSTVQGAYLLPEIENTAVDDQVNIYGALGHASVHSSGSDDAASGTGAHNGALVAELAHFVECVATSAPSQLCTPTDAVQVVQIAAAVVRSAADGGAPTALDPLDAAASAAPHRFTHHTQKE